MSTTMNTPYMKGKWNEMKGKLKEHWGKLTDDELDKVDGQRDRLLGLIQQHYGKAKDDADKELTRWEEAMGLR